MGKFGRKPGTDGAASEVDRGSMAIGSDGSLRGPSVPLEETPLTRIWCCTPGAAASVNCEQTLEQRGLPTL